MIRELFGSPGHNEGVQGLNDSMGKPIRVLELLNDTLKLAVDGGPLLNVFDEGQSCCESRYMRTDDDPAQFIGATLVSVEVRTAPSIDGEYGDEHEVQFLVVVTDRGHVTFSNHNEHNGYYGGFAITVKRSEEPEAVDAVDPHVGVTTE